MIPVEVKTIFIPTFCRGPPKSELLKSMRMAIPKTISGNAMGTAKTLFTMDFKGKEYLLREYAVGIANNITRLADKMEVLRVS